jgi:uncharacterized protein YhbP (UPF0306 family)
MPVTVVKFAREVTDYLGLHHIITLSTASFTGMPHADTVSYASDELALFVGMVPRSPIALNVRDNKYIAFTIDDYTTDWRKVRELQGKGECHAASEEERSRASQLFAAKFPHLNLVSVGELYAIRPLEVHFVDYDYPSVVEGQLALGTPEVTSRLYQFDGAAPAPAGTVSTSLDQHAFGAGEIIFRPGDDAGSYYVIVSGTVEVRGEGYGADQTVVRLGPGQMFGDSAGMRGQRGIYTAHAVDDTVLLAIDRNAVSDMLLQRPPDA